MDQFPAFSMPVVLQQQQQHTAQTLLRHPSCLQELDIFKLSSKVLSWLERCTISTPRLTQTTGTPRPRGWLEARHLQSLMRGRETPSPQNCTQGLLHGAHLSLHLGMMVRLLWVLVVLPICNQAPCFVPGRSGSFQQCALGRCFRICVSEGFASFTYNESLPIPHFLGDVLVLSWHWALRGEQGAGREGQGKSLGQF